MSKHVHAAIAAPPLMWNRPRLRFLDGAAADPAPAGGQQEEQKQEKSFSESEVNRIVKERLDRQARNDFGDYADLKARAEGAKTLEQQVADLTAKHAASESRALRSDVATKHGISAEDRDLFLTGTDEATLTAQAKRLAERVADQKKQGGYAPKEGSNATGPTGDEAREREFVRGLFESVKHD